MDRFAGKKVYKTKVTDGINKPGELIDAVLSDATPLYHSNTDVSAPDNALDDNEGAGRKVYDE